MGLLRRARPQADRQAAGRRRAFSPLTMRILAVNLFGLVLLCAGVLYVNQLRSGLIDVQIQALITEGEIIAAAITEAGDYGPEDTTVRPGDAQDILRRLVVPTRTRARLFSARGDVVEDTAEFTNAQVRTYALPPPDEGFDPVKAADRVYEWLVTLIPGPALPVYREGTDVTAADLQEVEDALRGLRASAVRENSQGELVVSVAVPVQRFKVVMGALLLSTEGGQIDAIVRAERFAIVRVFLLATAVMVLLSFVLARGIGRPIARLSRAADAVRYGQVGSGGADRAQIPDLGRRRDEIGDLSAALQRMLDALYARIDAIESFAADVAHEIKNPLTSLKSAVESLDRTKDPEKLARLVEVVQSDVKRLDRLISDISNASRLDAELVRDARAPVDVARMLEAIVAIYRDRIAPEQVRFELDIGQDPLIVSGLESRLGQVVRNIVDNAISFAPPGSEIRLAASAAGGTVRISIEDEGPGLPPDTQELIFRRFYTERPETEAFGTHSGLGLSISRQIVEAHGGRIWAENATDADGAVTGARFIVELPL
ncbi:MAG: sensor histidine kinase [Alphaproteobacteria bacterium]|nr:sensor histidine kinase [Alphaproteobacteria bacterium]MDX5370013.1 sensor histidine kinase [Alphaproteobacteria bacterium]MDX5464591.1 sensor histidine kinase [Alphaproteobacteria bacterium]